MTQHLEIWCDRDEHKLFEHFSDFNEWLDSGEEESAQIMLVENHIDNLAQPSKAFFASDKEAYDQSFKAYRILRRYEVLGKKLIE